MIIIDGFIETKEELKDVLVSVIGKCFHGMPDHQIEEAFAEAMDKALYSKPNALLHW